MTVSTVRSASRPRPLVTSRYSDSGVVTTKLGGRRTIRARWELGGVAGADRHPDVGRLVAQLGGHGGDLGQRPLEVLGDVDGQRLQRRHVDHPGHRC